MNVPRETISDASRARDADEALAQHSETVIQTLQRRANRDRLKFTLPPEPVSAEEMARHDVIVSPVGQAMIDADAAAEKYIREYWAKKAEPEFVWAAAAKAAPIPTWLTTRPVVFAIGTAAGALFVWLMRGWS